MEEKEEDENINQILDIMKNSYNQYYERSQSVDNKIGFLITFHAAIVIFILDFEGIKEILKSQYSDIGSILLASFQSILYFIIFALGMTSICMFVWNLKGRNIKYLLSTICDSKYYKCKNIDLKKELLKGYKEVAQNNEEVIERKYKIYNIASIITIIEIILIGIIVILKVCI